ncbi:MAG: PHP domain-containing protein [Clostridia bacterium]|nr:PHP domain-containing protein [Clostridia bacterium]
MKKYYYDLHIHSCLSPCGDDDNTPNNIAGMASLCELDIVALTDHNSCKNCPAFFEAAESHGLVPVAGMELTTSEDIHVVCLFERLDDAMRFDEYVEKHSIKIKNNPDIFGKQSVLDKNDDLVSEVEHLLINATDISISTVKDLVENYGGICYPAHIDRDSNGVIAVLGTLPQDTPFDFYELHNSSSIDPYSSAYGIAVDRFIISSDSHYLTDFRDKDVYIELDENEDSNQVRSSLFKYLRRHNE